MTDSDTDAESDFDFDDACVWNSDDDHDVAAELTRFAAVVDRRASEPIVMSPPSVEQRCAHCDRAVPPTHGSSSAPGAPRTYVPAWRSKHAPHRFYVCRPCRRRACAAAEASATRTTFLCDECFEEHVFAGCIGLRPENA